ncbi:hypothetical protein N7512_008545 [Penicillium capsulatum]|nr:hypothetical protein N7512_008545 [Penicillium capsulatum]
MSFPVPYVASMPPYMESQYIHSVPGSLMDGVSAEQISRSSPPQVHVPPSPTSSAGDGRISKARKGKRVHACEFPGCPKIFTRAEHRRRHELSHKAKKTYICTHEGCEKAFHRSDYLTQHMARHESGSPKQKSPSVRSNSTSSPAAVSQAFSSRSPVLPGFHTPGTSPSAGTTSSVEHPAMNWQSQSSNQLYNYQAPMSANAVSSVQMLSPQSAPSPMTPAFDAAIDQYLRSVLRPEAFLPAHQSQEAIDGSYWGSNIDPNLPRPINNTLPTNGPPPQKTWPPVFPPSTT